jgi:ABC-2 type transport system ATP-binding protein
VLDEPTVGLDIASKRAIIAQARALVRDRNVGVLWTTHLLDEIEPDDHVLVLHRGRALAQGIVRDVTAGHADLRAAFATLTGTQ